MELTHGRLLPHLIPAHLPQPVQSQEDHAWQERRQWESSLWDDTGLASSSAMPELCPPCVHLVVQLCAG